MIPVDYLFLRLVMRFAPEGIVQFVLNRKLDMTPGTETSDPALVARRYQETLAQSGRRLADSSVFILGYGGYYGLAVELLLAGARQVTLCDPYAVEQKEANLRLAEKNRRFFQADGEPDARYINLINEDVRRYAERGAAAYDLVLSWSIFEHLDDPPSIVAALSQLTGEEGFNIHFIDMRDHFFNYPFEMYCHTQSRWNRWLNPSSNLNRWRVWQYEIAFKAYFDRVRIFNLESDVSSFRLVKDRMLPEFKSGEESVDAVTRIQISASKPRRLT